MSRPFNIALAVLGILGCIVVGDLAGLVGHGKWLSLFFALAFSLSLVSEIAMRPPQSPTLAEVWRAGGLVAAAGILAASAFLLGWESAVFMLLFSAIWVAA